MFRLIGCERRGIEVGNQDSSIMIRNLVVLRTNDFDVVRAIPIWRNRVDVGSKQNNAPIQKVEVGHIDASVARFEISIGFCVDAEGIGVEF